MYQILFLIYTKYNNKPKTEKEWTQWDRYRERESYLYTFIEYISPLTRLFFVFLLFCSLNFIIVIFRISITIFQNKNVPCHFKWWRTLKRIFFLSFTLFIHPVLLLSYLLLILNLLTTLITKQNKNKIWRQVFFHFILFSNSLLFKLNKYLPT